MQYEYRATCDNRLKYCSGFISGVVYMYTNIIIECLLSFCVIPGCPSLALHLN